MSTFAAPASKLKAACDAPGFAQILEASAPIDARAVWIDSKRLIWAGQPAAQPRDGAYRLYHSAAGRLRTTPGQHVLGHDGAAALSPVPAPTDAALAARFRYLGAGLTLAVAPGDAARLRTWHRGQMVLVHQTHSGDVIAATAVQAAAALDDLYASAEHVSDFGVSIKHGHTTFKLWAPTARAVSLCLHDAPNATASAVLPLARDARSGVWRLQRRSPTA